MVPLRSRAVRAGAACGRCCRHRWRGIGWRACGVVSHEPSQTSSEGWPWRLGAWNQHRVGSYAQQNCPWVAPLKALGAKPSDMEQLVVQSVHVAYDEPEVHDWVGTCDAVALQEVDAALRQVLSKAPGGGQLLESERHVDGRGVEVDSTVAVFVRAEGGLRVLRREHAELSLTLPRRASPVRIARDHVAALLEQSDGRLLLLCSVHLHPPDAAAQARVDYLIYIAPLKDMLLRILDGVQSRPVTCAVVGDFNVSASGFAVLTSGDPFWDAFVPVTCPDGATAHHSNPSETGDFGFFCVFDPAAPPLRPEWNCTALGDARFVAFERFAAEVLAGAAARLPLLRAAENLGHAGSSLARVQGALGLNCLDGQPLALRPSAGPQERSDAAAACSAAPSPLRPPPPPPPPSLASATSLQASVRMLSPRAWGRRRPVPPPPPVRRPPLPAGLAAFLESAVADLERFRGLLALGGEEAVGEEATLRKGLLTSDHRPLLFAEKSLGR